MTCYCRLGPFGAQVNLDTHIDAESYQFNRSALKDMSHQSDYPFSTGERVKVYDTLCDHSFNLTWTVDGPDPYLSGEQETLERLMRLGESWQFDLYEEFNAPAVRMRDRQTVVWIDNIAEGYLETEGRRVAITLKDSYRRILSDCDALTLLWGATAWSVSGGSGGETIAVDTTIMKEGTGDIKISDAALPLANTLVARLDPASYFDSTGFKWVGFWFRTDRITDTPSFEIVFWKDVVPNSITYNFTALITTANTWYFVRIPRASFTEAGVFDWTDCRYVTVECGWGAGAATKNVNYYVDELSLIE